MRIAILGANGYLGSYLTEFLFHNHYIIPVTRETVNLSNYADVDRWLIEAQPDVVVNATTSGSGLRVNDINYTDVQTDLGIFFNFYNNPRCPRYINIGSGAEFDRRTIIHNAKEENIVLSRPLESYGFAKNIIARAVLNRVNFYTLRLFGCFDPSEPNIRLFKKFLAGKVSEIEDKIFDYISAEDFARIVDYYCTEEHPQYKDINCVYYEKHLISDYLSMLNEIKGTELTFKVTNKTWSYYTGSGKKLQKLGLELKGLEEGLKKYE